MRHWWLGICLVAACSVVNSPDDPVQPGGSAGDDGGGPGTGGELTGGNGGSGAGTGAGGSPASCGDGVISGSDECDDGNMLSGDGCDQSCIAELGYECNDEPSMCTAICGDGLTVGAEGCDDANAMAADGCSDTCTVEAGYNCSGEPSLCCLTPLTACNGQCIDTSFDANNCGACPNPCPMNQVCANGTCSGCLAGATLLSISPNGGELLCDDPNNVTCEENFEQLCPTGWGLCTHLQHANRQANWTFAIAGQPVLGEIYCRSGGGAGHYTVGVYFGEQTLANNTPFNCNYGSARPPCPSGFGCNEQSSYALCCKPTPTCGNGVTDAPEEECDDMNMVETDACLSSCVLRQPSGCN